MAVLDRYIGELEALRSRVAVDALTNPEQPDAYGFGKAVGRLEGLKLAEEALQKLLSQPEDERESGRNRSKA